jgi:hypothetical protein
VGGDHLLHPAELFRRNIIGRLLSGSVDPANLRRVQPGEDTDLQFGMTIFATSIPPQVIPASAVVPEI